MKIRYKSRGLGDTIDKITTATGIKKIASIVSSSSEETCTPCEERRKLLNEKFPYNNNENV